MKADVIVPFFAVAIAASVHSNDIQIKTVWSGGLNFEGPHWSTTENALYWVDYYKDQVFRMDGESGNVTSRKIGSGRMSFVISVKDNPGLLLVSARTELFLLRWDAPPGSDALHLLSAVDFGMPDNRIDDGKVDAKGRLWFGTMSADEKKMERDKGSLYMMDEHSFRNPEIKVKPVSISNGIAWSADKKSMFYNDSPTKNVDVFDFNLETGEIGNRRHLFSFEKNGIPGIPDGMTIDKDDNLWVACFKGGMVIKIDSETGDLLEKLLLPAAKVSSVMWGGPGLSTLYVTTGKAGLSRKQLMHQPGAGSLFAIEGIGTNGLPENQFVYSAAAKY